MQRVVTKTVLSVLFLLITTSSFGQNDYHFMLPKGATENDLIKKTIIIKVKHDYAALCKNNQIDLPPLNSIFDQLGIVKLYKKFPNIKAPETGFNKFGQKLANLSLIYEIEYNSATTIVSAINSIYASGVVDYAQPHYISYPLDYVPNDPLITNQYHLDRIKSFQAWDITKGDTNVVIAISDWGTDISHPDLLDNIKYNRLDPIDGIDNDNDGYLDNYRGWDLGENDNNPTGYINHGTFTAGLAAATPDNNIGVSGSGFHCKILPIKVCNASNQGTMTYESIVYAVEHGCSIVNCSWGNTFNTGPYGQDVIDYASINKEALVVAACGNDNSIVAFYPASYNYVLSVASSDINDNKSSSSSYGYFVDISTPGDNVWSTDVGGTYNAYSGTSHASPITAGCAALLKSKYPSLTGLQIAEKLKVSSDIIDTISSNLPYKDLLGAGRLNVFSALNDSTHPSIKMYSISTVNALMLHELSPGDTITVRGDFVNYLAASGSNLKATISCASPYVTVVDSVFNAGIIPTFGTTNNNASPFRIKIKPTIPDNEELVFKITYNDDNYRAVQYFTEYANTNYITIDTNKIATTLTSNGQLGFIRGNSLQGLGFRYNNGETMMYSGGFIVARSASQVSDVIYNDAGWFDNDFKVSSAIEKIIPSVISDFDVVGRFNDSLAGVSKINVGIIQRAYAWRDSPNDKFIILEYNIINNNSNLISGIYAGLYVDWDIKNSLSNRIEYDATSKMGYCFSPEGSDYAGIAMISEGDLYHYAFDNDGANGSIKIADGFTTSEKYVAIKTNRAEAGLSGSGNDVSEMMSSGPFTIAAGDSVKIIFALIAGDHLGDLQNSAAEAKQVYYQTGIHPADKTDAGISLFQNQPNPFKEETKISFYLDKKSTIELSYCNLSGVSSEIIFKGALDKGLHSFMLNKNLGAGIYVYSLSGEDFCLKKKLCVIR